MEQLSPQDVLPRLADGQCLLLDVRQPEELELARIKGAKAIPMGEIPARIGELNPQQPIAVLCHHGMRSLQVARFLERNGFSTVFNVAGGIEAWSDLDPAIPKY